MTPKEIGRKAGRIFVGLIPPNWALRSQEDQEDYGIDYEVELTTPQDQATGFIFKIQQKGAAQVELNAGQDQIIFSGLETSKLRYYLHQIPVPVVFVVVDVASGSAYWLILQGTPAVEAAYRDAVANQQKTLTLHIPITNRLPATTPALLKEVKNCFHWLLVRGIDQLTIPQLANVIRQGVPLNAIADAFGRHHDFLRLEQIEAMIHDGQHAAALAKAEQILASGSESPEVRFAAGLDVVRIRGGVAARSAAPLRAEEYMRTRHAVYGQLLQIVRPHTVAKHLRLYARFLMRCVSLRIAAERDLGVFTSRQVQAQSGDDLARLLTDAVQMKATTEAARQFRRMQTAVLRMVERGHYHLLPQAWSQMASDATPFLLRLHGENMKSQLGRIVAWLDTVADAAIEVARQLRHWEDVILCAMTQTNLALAPATAEMSARIEKARAIITAIPDGTMREHGLHSLQEYETAMRGATDEPSIDDEIQIHRQLAISLGIDPDDPHNEISRIIRIGLNDLNPERVLKHCEHFFVSIGPSGVPARMVGLPTAGSKWLHCTKLGYAIMGLTLDGVYETFAQEHCRTCPDRSPRPADWRWTRRWQQEQDRLHSAFAERTRHPRPSE